MSKVHPVELIYRYLYQFYGPQGWWPIDGMYIDKSCLSRKEQFEIAVGSILTQNTNWKNVEQSLNNLRSINLICPKKIQSISLNQLEKLINPSGFYRQKAKKLKLLSGFILNLKDKSPTRKQLLQIWGIGPETADSILLYAYNKFEFVIDSYTKRIFLSLGILNEKMSYDEIKQVFEFNLPRDIILYQEFHSLIVTHAKNFYVKNKFQKCPLHYL